MNRMRTVTALLIFVVLVVTLAASFLTRGVMSDLPFLQVKKGDWSGAYVLSFFCTVRKPIIQSGCWWRLGSYHP